MPSEWVQQCEGYATYRWHEDGGIEVQGDGFWNYGTDSKQADNIRKFWDKYGKMFKTTAGELGLPVAWVVGIVFVESGGDEWACSPCAPPHCGLKDCGGGIAKDGKHYVCCAYGLMQVIDSNARHYGGLKNGAQLLGNPFDSIRIGCKIYQENLSKSEGDPLVAVRRYNGCTVCKGGRVTSCNPSCPFGIGGQGGYAEKFAKAVNTFLMLDLSPGGYQDVDVSESKAGINFVSLGIAAGFFVAAYFVGKNIFK